MKKQVRSSLKSMVPQQDIGKKQYVPLFICAIWISFSLVSCTKDTTNATTNENTKPLCCYVGRELNELHDSSSIASVREAVLQYVNMSEKIPNPWVGQDSLTVHSLLYYTMHIDSVQYVYVNVRKNSELNLVSSKLEPKYLKLIIRQKQNPPGQIEIYDPALHDFKKLDGDVSNCWFTE